MDAGRGAKASMRQDELTTGAQNTPSNPFPSPHSLRNRAGRALWQLVWVFLFRPSPRIFHAWRRTLLRLFGARIGFGAHIHSSVKIWAPWNLEMGAHSCLGHSVDCYNVAPVSLGPFSTVSQYSYLCTATHDYTNLRMPLISRPIRVGPHAWVAADVFIGPGVAVGEGAIVGARSSVFRDLEPWTVVAGCPAGFLKRRLLIKERGALA